MSDDGPNPRFVVTICESAADCWAAGDERTAALLFRAAVEVCDGRYLPDPELEVDR